MKYIEDWCRRLTSTFSDVYVFTVPLYLPHKDPDGKWRVVSIVSFVARRYVLNAPFPKNYKVIGSPPNVSVPTHFTKVVLASRLASLNTPDVHEISTGAFVSPNAVILDEAPFESFVTPGT